MPKLKRATMSKKRARRFPLQLPASYRVMGQATWQSGRTLNISRSGVLFQALEMLQPGLMRELDRAGEVEIRLALELEGCSQPPSVVCRARVVRSPKDPSCQVAARILNYRLAGRGGGKR
jgi:hypothetical protein